MSTSRADLLGAAAEEFSLRGLHGTRIQAIVDRAGVNERMIYHHFSSKEGLYRAVLADQRQQLAAAWVPVLEKAEMMEPYAGMRLCLSGFFDTLMSRPLAVALLLHETLSSRQGTATAQLGAEMLPKQMRELYGRGQDSGVFRADSAFEIAYVTATGALMSLAIFNPVGAGRAEVAADLRDQMVNQLMDGMTGPPDRV